MIINVDAKGIEWRAFLHLSNDKVGIKEVEEGVDIHSVNQKAFGLPERRIAKIFLFRSIYCPYSRKKETAWAFANDPLFSQVGGEAFWLKVTEKLWEKYYQGAEWHQAIIKEVVETGKLVMETGRIYEFEPRLSRGEYKWPITDIANYPVQGISADIMAIVRSSLRHHLPRWRALRGLACNTVHDSLVIDVDNNNRVWYNICIDIKAAFQAAAKNYEALFGVPLHLPMDCEIKVGTDWYRTHVINIKE